MESIWRIDASLEALNAGSKGNMLEHLDIKLTEIGPDYLKGTMPVDHRTKQPMGLLHGGASVVLAESLGSLSSTLTVDLEKQRCVGLEINANHIRSATEGLVTGIAKPIHLGRSTQVWEIKIYDDKERIVCISRLTMAVINVRK